MIALLTCSSLFLIVLNSSFLPFCLKMSRKDIGFWKISDGKSASRKQSLKARETVKKENLPIFLDQDVCSSEFKRFWQVWVKTWSLYWIIRARCKKKKKTWKSVRNNYFFLLLANHQQKDGIGCKSKGNNFTLNSRYRQLRDFQASSHASVCLGSCILLWRVNAL